MVAVAEALQCCLASAPWRARHSDGGSGEALVRLGLACLRAVISMNPMGCRFFFSPRLFFFFVFFKRFLADIREEQ